MVVATCSKEKALQALRSRVIEERTDISYKAFSYCNNVSANVAKAWMYELYASTPDSYFATFLVSGILGRSDNTTSYAVKIVPQSSLEETKALFHPVTGVHIYALSPKQENPDSFDLASFGLRVAMEEKKTISTLYSGPMTNDNVLRTNSLSSIVNPSVTRRSDGLAIIASPLATAPVPQTANPHASSTGTSMFTPNTPRGPASMFARASAATTPALTVSTPSAESALIPNPIKRASSASTTNIMGMFAKASAAASPPAASPKSSGSTAVETSTSSAISAPFTTPVESKTLTTSALIKKPFTFSASSTVDPFSSLTDPFASRNPFDSAFSLGSKTRKKSTTTSASNSNAKGTRGGANNSPVDTEIRLLNLQAGSNGPTRYADFVEPDLEEAEEEEQLGMDAAPIRRRRLINSDEEEEEGERPGDAFEQEDFDTAWEKSPAWEKIDASTTKSKSISKPSKKDKERVSDDDNDNDDEVEPSVKKFKTGFDEDDEEIVGDTMSVVKPLSVASTSSTASKFDNESDDEFIGENDEDEGNDKDESTRGHFGKRSASKSLLSGDAKRQRKSSGSGKSSGSELPNQSIASFMRPTQKTTAEGSVVNTKTRMVKKEVQRVNEMGFLEFTEEWVEEEVEGVDERDERPSALSKPFAKHTNPSLTKSVKQNKERDEYDDNVDIVETSPEETVKKTTKKSSAGGKEKIPEKKPVKSGNIFAFFKPQAK